LLREKVTSPGGVTEKALEVFNEKAVSASIVEAILKATEKSKALGES
jgi:pyrroline-5-carboxylate reductase